VNGNPVTIKASGAGDTSQYDYDNYRFTYSLSPYPKAGTQIQKSDYRLAMTVTKP
jgi:hypothetical protein